MRPRRVDRAAHDAEQFVLDAVRAYATARTCPLPPTGDAWIALAATAGVLPTVAAVLGSTVTDARLFSARVAAAATSMRVGLELRTVSDALDGLRWAVLKGPILADVVYRSDNSRVYDDLDVLVHPADLDGALAALTAGGFRPIDRNWPMIRRMRRGEISLIGPAGMALDLHWHLVNDPKLRAQLRVDVPAMLREVRRTELAGLSVPHLAPKDMVVHVALHAVLSGGHRLKWLLDLHQSIRWSACDPAEIGWRARVHGVGPLVRVMLDRVADHVDPEIEAWADAAAPATLWTCACRRVSRAESPLADGTGRRSGRSVFSSTRRTGTSSVAQLASRLVTDRRDRRTDEDALAEVARLHTAVEAPAERAAWLAAAAAEVR